MSTVELCLDRIKKRNRAGEESITREYLLGLEEQYARYYDFWRGMDLAPENLIFALPFSSSVHSKK